MRRLEDKYISNFFKLGNKCEFPGCEGLRNSYIKELRATNSGGGCAACKRMSLVTKYKNIIKGRIGDSNG